MHYIIQFSHALQSIQSMLYQEKPLKLLYFNKVIGQSCTVVILTSKAQTPLLQFVVQTTNLQQVAQQAACCP